MSRQANALVGICRAKIASDPDRATVVVHVRATPTDGPAAGADHRGVTADSRGPITNPGTNPGAWFEIGACEVEGGPVLHQVVARRLMCDARIQVVIEGSDAVPIRMGRTSKEPSAPMMRQLRYRDRCCQFPGCGSTRFVQAHHIRHWSRAGRPTWTT
jgi:hypothetical protein